MIELMVCFETRYEDAHTLKSNRYTDLMGQIADSPVDGTLARGWELWFPVSPKLQYDKATTA